MRHRATALAPRTAVVAAYRADLKNNDGAPFGDHDDHWIAISSLLQHAKRLGETDSQPLVQHALREAISILGPTAVATGIIVDPPSPPPSPYLAFRMVAERMEDAGALRLAATLLDGCLGALGDLTSLERGRVMAQGGRVAWKLGHTSRAWAIYHDVERTGRDANLPELTVRAWLGKSVVTQLRGNLPSARRWAARSVALADAQGYRRLGALARTMLMVGDAKAERFEAALVHAWAIFEAVRGDPGEEAAALANLGQLLLDLGEPAAARAAFKSLFARTAAPRIVLPALGGFAQASALLDRGGDVRWAAREVERAFPLGTYRYEAAGAALECATALAHIGDVASARAFLQVARETAVRHGYHELAYHADPAGLEGLPGPETSQHRTSTQHVATVTQALHELEPDAQPLHVVDTLAYAPE